ncbi:MAG: hypothetical protein Terrestrivirus5_134 [Terrestrivirus sp.]|uniref:Uncharacterized protein n=1 Tax=Terrestrivirus sp. TaxID=2487775 RepID=A0A3G4ZN75_9VIRU|nr:MAG: hypothetical protein Terrestrivirus5_134 [Terrestrivirus sp.]
MFRRINYQKVSPSNDSSSESLLEMEQLSLYPVIDPSYLTKTVYTNPTNPIGSSNHVSSTNPFYDLIDLSETPIANTNANTNQGDNIRLPVTTFEQKFDYTKPDATLQDTLQTEFEVIKFPYTVQNVPAVTSLIIRSKNNDINIYKNKIVTSKPVLVSQMGNSLKIWDAYYSENRIMAMDGSTVLNGYYIRDLDDNKILVKNKINMTEFPVRIGDSIFNIDFQGDECNVKCDNNLFDGRTVNIKSRGYSKLDLGMSKFVDINQNVSISDVIFCKIEDNPMSSNTN